MTTRKKTIKTKEDKNEKMLENDATLSESATTESLSETDINTNNSEKISSNNLTDNIKTHDSEEIKVESLMQKSQIKKIKKIKKSKNFSFFNAQRYEPNIKVGLTSEQVNERIENGYVNYMDNKNTKTYKSIFFSNIFTFFNMLCFAVAAALIAVGSFNNLFFMVILLANMTIGIIQEIKAKLTIEKIRLVTTNFAKVRRNGKDLDIKTSDVVLDDIILFAFGDQICSDSIILKGEVEVNESLLTGESVSIKKKKGDMLLAGSYITSGNCICRVDRVAEANYTSQLQIKAKKYKKPDSELMGSLKLIIKVIGFLIIPLALGIFFVNKQALNNNIQMLITKSAGSIIGMIPAGLFLLTSLALSVGVIKLAKKKTLVQDLYGIEMLSRTNVLCLDKTGTITDGTMNVKQIKMLKKEDNLNKIVSSMLGSFATYNQTFLALKKYFGEDKFFEAESVIEFNSSKKYSAVTFKNGKSYVLGAPEFVKKNRDKKINEYISQYTQSGYRVLLLCETTDDISKTIDNKDLAPICLIAIEERIRKEAKETIKWFNENGVQIKIISGDNPVTVSQISQKVGVIGAEKYISLDGLTDQQVIESVNEYNVFGRVSPEQKAIIVKALKNAQYKVAMTGDGVNDILALKEADCSISVASGSEAARNVSHLVLLDSNFLNLPTVVEEGRRVVNNIVNSASLFLMKTFFTIALTVFCLCTSINYPFVPNQILLLEFFTIGIPSFFLALQPNKEKIKGKFINLVAMKSVLYGTLLFGTFIACFLYSKHILGGATYETMSSLAITFVGLIILLKICKPLNWYRALLYVFMVLGTVLSLEIIPWNFYSYVTLSREAILFIMVVVLASFVLLNLDNYINFDKIFKKNHNTTEKDK